MSMKTMMNEISDAIVRIIARKRVTSRSNWALLMGNEINDVYLKQLDEKQKERLLKAAIKEPNFTNHNAAFTALTSTGCLGWNNGYVEGLLYGKKMLDEESYTKAEMIRLIRLIPNCVAFYTLGASFGLGFVEGLFGGDGKSGLASGNEKNGFVKKWKLAILNELYNCIDTVS